MEGDKDGLKVVAIPDDQIWYKNVVQGQLSNQVIHYQVIVSVVPGQLSNQVIHYQVIGL
jgi:hypothetical protein